MKTTDTPRTDAACFSSRDPIELMMTSQQLERELNASKAEVERLKKELADWDYGTRAEREQKRAEKAEAEIERLRSVMRSFIDFMDENMGTTADWPMEAAFDNEETCKRHCDLLNAMKHEVKPEDIN
jgi:exonuclease VII large subunit